MAQGADWAKRKDMTSKQYLSQIKKLDIMINQRIEEAKELVEIAVGLRSPELKQDVVQASPSGDPIGIAMNRYMDLQKEIDDMIDKFVDLKHKIIGEIQQMEDTRYAELLYYRYVQYMSIAEIADTMHYGYEYVCRLHGRALQAFKWS